MKSEFYIWTIIILWLFLLLFIRPVNYDEAYYSVSSKHITEGMLPYRDFMFHHMPLMPFIYACASPEGINALIFGRILSIIFLISSALILKSILKQVGFSSLWRNIFLVFFFGNAFLIDWMIPIRIYVLSVFLLSCACYFFCKYISGNNFYFISFCGFFFSLLFLSKIVYAASIACTFLFLFWLKLSTPPRKEFKPIIYFSAGIMLPLILFYIVFHNHLDVWYADVIEVNLHLKSNYSQPWDTYKLFLPFIFPQNLILIAIILLSGFKYSNFEKFLIVNVFAVITIHVFTMHLSEYLSLIIPLLILLTVLRFEKFMESPFIQMLHLKRLGLMLLIIYLLLMPFSVSHFKHLLEQRKLTLNAVELQQFNSQLSSHEMYSVY
jgi:hypothetical protein